MVMADPTKLLTTPAPSINKGILRAPAQNSKLLESTWTKPGTVVPRRQAEVSKVQLALHATLPSDQSILKSPQLFAIGKPTSQSSPASRAPSPHLIFG